MRPLFIRTTLNTTLHFFWFPAGYVPNFSFSCKKCINRQMCIQRLLCSVFKLINCILTIYSFTPLSIFNFLFSVTTRFIPTQWQSNWSKFGIFVLLLFLSTLCAFFVFWNKAQLVHHSSFPASDTAVLLITLHFWHQHSYIYTQRNMSVCVKMKFKKVIKGKK